MAKHKPKATKRYQEILQTLVDHFVEIRVLLSVFSSYAAELDRYQKHGLTYHFDPETGDFINITSDPPLVEGLAETQDRNIGFAREAIGQLTEYLEILHREIAAADEGLSSLPDEIHDLLTATRSTHWRLFVRRHCLQELTRWPNIADDREFSERRPRLPDRADLFIEFASQVQPEAHFKTTDALLIELIRDVLAVAPELGAVVTAGAAVEQYVTLLQMAAIVNRSKKTLERFSNSGDFLAPDIEGGGGAPHEWLWRKVRPVLEAKYSRNLPPVFPADQFIR